MIFRKKFKPFPLLSGVHLQTVFGSLFNLHPTPPSETKYIKLEDSDKIAVEVTTPKHWKETDPTVVLVHGLCGSDKSFYLIRMANKLYKKDIRAIRVNLRGCGSGKGLSRSIYHCGSSDDVMVVLSYLKETTPASPVSLIGFSLGGNIVLKLAGELGEGAGGYVRQVIAVSPPINLVSSMRLLCNPKNRLYERYFLRHLLDAVYDLQQRFPDLPRVYLPQNLTVFDFDELYVAPRLGYTSAFEYYKECSSIDKIQYIKVPCIILLSEDDPIVDPNDIDTVQLPDNVDVYKTDKGGHMGYIGLPGKDFRWLDSLLLSWIRFYDQ
ncbi:MAG: alpha/beta fold hydrolase [Chlamydiales bacterium]|nr:alpha/beta fold hydrolase [Chlamydiales bacterium]